MTTESELQEKLATCTRILSMRGLLGLFGHISAYHSAAGRVFISPGKGSDKSILQPSDMAVMDIEGNDLEGKGRVPIESPIHTALHSARADALAVAHLHSPNATLFAIARCEYRPVTLQGAMYGEGIPEYPEPHLITTPQRGKKLADLIGNKRAALLRGHGTVVIGKDIEEMLYACLTLEDDTRKAAQAIALGELRFFSPEECRQFESGVSLESRARRAWTYFTQLESRWDRQPASVTNDFV